MKLPLNFVNLLPPCTIVYVCTGVAQHYKNFQVIGKKIEFDFELNF